MAPVGEDEQDLTRKQRREQARADRKAAEEAVAAGAARRRRMIQLGGAVVVVVVAIIVILVATGTGGSAKAPGLAKGKVETTTVALVEKEVGGIPQSGNVLGSSSAPVTMEYFGDLECPFCREFTVHTLPGLIQKYVRSGKVKLLYRSLETATREPETFRTQQTAALAAGKQNKMWYFVELFYHEQGEEDSGYVTESYLQRLAQQVPGLDLSTWTSDRSDTALAAQIQTDAQEANNRGFSGTPSFLIGKSGGTLKKLEYSSVTEPGDFESAIEKLV